AYNVSFFDLAHLPTCHGYSSTTHRLHHSFLERKRQYAPSLMAYGNTRCCSFAHYPGRRYPERRCCISTDQPRHITAMARRFPECTAVAAGACPPDRWQAFFKKKPQDQPCCDGRPA